MCPNQVAIRDQSSMPFIKYTNRFLLIVKTKLLKTVRGLSHAKSHLRTTDEELKGERNLDEEGDQDINHCQKGPTNLYILYRIRVLQQRPSETLN